MSEQENKTGSKPIDQFSEHQRKAFEEAGKALDSLIPPEFKEHGKEAMSEFIEGFRVLFNAAVDEIKQEINDWKAKNPGSATEDGEATIKKVKVDVE